MAYNPDFNIWWGPHKGKSMQQMALRDYVEVLARRKWVIIITFLVAVAFAIVATLLTTPKYEATTTMRVLSVTGGSSDWVSYDTKQVERLMLQEPPDLMIEITLDGIRLLDLDQVSVCVSAGEQAARQHLPELLKLRDTPPPSRLARWWHKMTDRFIGTSGK